VYTQCSKCETVFKLSAEVLRAAGGQVRCGKCGEVFNALARLAEDANAFSAGESPLDLEARADRILESVAPFEVGETAAADDAEFAAPGVEIAQLEVQGWSVEEAADADRSMEFTLPPGELDRIFVESKKRMPFPIPPPAQQPPPPPEQSAPQPQPVPPAPPPQRAPEPPPHPESAVTGLEVPEGVRRDMQAGLEQRREAEIMQAVMEAELMVRAPAPRDARRQLILWLGGAAVSALLLIIQVVHQNREWFIAHAHGSFQPPSLSAYQLRQWGVTGDPDANGTLRVRASILNTAAQLQPYPLLRVTLADRFGKRIGTRDFEPAEYLGKPTARLLTPGERVDATLDILDPGKNAEGFEIDVCLRGADKKVSCANDVAPQAQR